MDSTNLRRLVLHELGHVIGLGHPDQKGQSVQAVMNSRTFHDTLQPDDIAGVKALYPPKQAVAGVLESPAAGAAVSGIGFLSGWKCDAQDITIRVDGGTPIAVAMDIPRADTRSTCGREINNGFIMQTNWNWLSEGTHTAVAYDNGVEFARSTFTVGTTGEEFLKGITVSVDVPNFPAPGETGRFVWNESTQHLELAEVISEPEIPQPPPSQLDFEVFRGNWAFTYPLGTFSWRVFQINADSAFANVDSPGFAEPTGFLSIRQTELPALVAAGYDYVASWKTRSYCYRYAFSFTNREMTEGEVWRWDHYGSNSCPSDPSAQRYSAQAYRN